LKTEKGTMQILYGGRKAELVLFGNDNFLVEGKTMKKIVDGKFIDVTKEEFERIFNENKGKITTTVPVDVFNALERALGKFEIVF